MITINNLRVNYNSFVALDIKSKISILSGDRIGIIGGNGAGKTTFVKALSGLVDFEGDVVFDISKDDIALHLQENSYTKRIKVKCLIEAILVCDVYKNQKLMQIIKFFDFEKCLKQRVAELSGGQRQKLTIIMILYQDRKLTFFDEVTSGLDFESRQKLMQEIAQWYQGRENAICIVSHYYDELENLINKLLIIDNGNLIDFGKVDELFEKYCGKAVYVLENNSKNIDLTANFEKLKSPNHLIAIKSTNAQTEKTITDLFVANGVDYKRSSKDIEILYSNAVYSAREGKNG